MATFPESVLAAVNLRLVAIADRLLTPLLGWSPLVSLLLLSLLTAVLVVAVVRRTTDQECLRQTKRRMQAALFEIRLFNDDPGTVLAAVGDALRHNVRYLRLSLVPVVLLAGPLALIMAHLQPFYGYEGLQVGSTPLLQVAPSSSATAGSTLSLEVPEAIEIESGPVQLVGTGEWLWRIRPVAPGDFVLVVRYGNETISKTVRVAAPGRRSPSRVQPGVVRQFLHPSEPPLLPDGSVSALRVGYPLATLVVFGMGFHWAVVYVGLTIAWAVVIARAAGIAI